VFGEQAWCLLCESYEAHKGAEWKKCGIFKSYGRLFLGLKGYVTVNVLQMELCHFCAGDLLVSPTPFSPSPPWRECLSTFIKHSHVSSSRSVHKSELQWAVVLVNDRHGVEKKPAHPPKRTHKVSQFPGDQLFAEDRRNGASYRKGWWCDMRGRVGKGWSEWREIKKKLFGQAKTDITVRQGTLQ
jgi:hypothetical protein